MQEENLQEKLWENAAYFKKGLKQLGFNTGQSETPITPVIIGDGARAMAFSDALLEEGVFCTGIGYPTVPEDKSRVRTIVTAAHTREDLEQALEAFARVKEKLQV
jgi:glycine C-acetyltransferase